MMGLKSVATNLAKRGARMKAGAKEVGHAYKTTPAPRLGEDLKRHKVGIGLTAASFAPIHVASNRRSTHTGIDQKEQ